MGARRSMLGLLTVLCLVGAALAVIRQPGEARGSRPAADPAVTAVSAGGNHSCARTSDGAAWCWGFNFFGEVGDGTTTQRTRAVRVTKDGGSFLSDVTAVSAGYRHSCARRSDGTAWCWGDNENGQLGDGTTNRQTRAVRVTKSDGSVLAGVTAVSAGGFHSCARTSDGSAWCWGRNENGQLGNGTTTQRTRAVRVTKAGGGALVGVTATSAGFFHSCARTSDGAAWCWGSNWAGQLGNGTTTQRTRAVQVVKSGGGFLTGVAIISAGSAHSCARASAGAAWCWGANELGEVGDGTTTQRTRAVQVVKAGGGVLAGVTAVSAAFYRLFSCAQTRDAAAWCWGENVFGQLGDGTTTQRTRAVQVVKSGGGFLTGVAVISAGSAHSCARTSDGAAWCWGCNGAGQLGYGTTTDRHRAVPVAATWATAP